MYYVVNFFIFTIGNELFGLFGDRIDRLFLHEICLFPIKEAIIKFMISFHPRKLSEIFRYCGFRR